MRIFLSGGCKNGKSYFAQRLATLQRTVGKPLYYVATMEPTDQEDHVRILRHQKEREGWGFETLEIDRGIGLISADFSGSFLLDSLTALLSNEMFSKEGTVDETAYLRVAEEIKTFLDKTEDIVVVSDYIYSDAFEYESLTEQYRKGLAFLDKTAAKQSDLVIEVVYGNPQVIKGDARLLDLILEKGKHKENGGR